MVSMVTPLRLFTDAGWEGDAPPSLLDGLHVRWAPFDYVRNVPATFQGDTLGGMWVISRRSWAVEALNVNAYWLVLQADSELGGPPFPWTYGFGADPTYTRIKVDHVVVEGTAPTPPEQPDHLFLPAEEEPGGAVSPSAPLWEEGQVNAGGAMIGAVSPPWCFINGSPNEGGSAYGEDVPGTEHILIHVVPEPAGAVLLGVGGWMALRRRR